MPTYLYVCPTCQSRRDIFKPLALLNREESCEKCQAAMERRLCATAVAVDYAGYACPITGTWVEGKKAHQENLKRHGCRVLETGETEEARSRRRQEETALDRGVDETVEQYWEALPTDKREALATAVTTGLDVSIERK